jgi:putative transposase
MIIFERLKKNRLVNPDNIKNMQIQEIEIPPEGKMVHLKAYGFIKIFIEELRIVLSCRLEAE